MLFAMAFGVACVCWVSATSSLVEALREAAFCIARIYPCSVRY